MKRFKKVTAITEIDNEIVTVEVLDYDKNKYCTIKLPNGNIKYVKKYSLYSLPKGFNFHHLPDDYLEQSRLTSKEVASNLRSINRYHYKTFGNMPIEMTLKFYNSDEMKYSDLIKEVKGTRKQLLKYLYSLPKNKVNNFSLRLNFFRKNGSTFGSCFTYKDGHSVTYSFRNKKQDKYIKQLLRSMFEINVR